MANTLDLVIESINTNSKYFQITTDGATFGDMSTGEYTKLGQHGFEHVDGTGSRPYFYITTMQNYQVYQSSDTNGKVTKYCKFTDSIKKMLNGKVPIVHICNKHFGESSPVGGGEADVISVDANGFTLEYQVWEYNLTGGDYWKVTDGGYLDFDALIIA